MKQHDIQLELYYLMLFFASRVIISQNEKPFNGVVAPLTLQTMQPCQECCQHSGHCEDTHVTSIDAKTIVPYCAVAR